MLDKIGGVSAASLVTDMQQIPHENNGAANGLNATSDKNDKSPFSKLEEILPPLIKLLQQLVDMIDSAQAGGTSSENNGQNQNRAAESLDSGGMKAESPSAGTGSDKIPAPTEHMQQFNLGGKTVAIGGDGSASAGEVQSTADSIKNLYQNSDTFKNMIDSSSNKGFEVSVGKRSDNMSWGNSEGRVFMNLNNISPGNSDTFQSLLGHEFAHASIDLSHGAQMEKIESAVAAQA